MRFFQFVQRDPNLRSKSGIQNRKSESECTLGKFLVFRAGLRSRLSGFSELDRHL